MKKEQGKINDLFNKDVNPVMNMRLKDIIVSIVQAHDDKPWKTSTHFSIGKKIVDRYNRRAPIDNFEPLKHVFNMMGQTGLPLEQLKAKIAQSVTEQTNSNHVATEQLGVSKEVLDDLLGLYQKNKDVIEKTLTGPA